MTPKSLIDLRRSAPRARFPTALSPKSPETKPLRLLAAAYVYASTEGRPWWLGVYPWVIKHGNGTYPMNGGFIRKITDKWSVFHCHVWLPEGSPTLEPPKKWWKINKLSRMDVNVQSNGLSWDEDCLMDPSTIRESMWGMIYRVTCPFLQGTYICFLFGPCGPFLVSNIWSTLIILAE